MSTKIIGNQIDQVTRAIIEALQVTEQINLPALNQSQVNALGTPAFGTVVYNSTEDMAQIYKQDAAQGVAGWTDVGGGGPSLGEKSIIRTNANIIEENITVGSTANGGPEFQNGATIGPVTIANGYTVTIENGASWNIIGEEDGATAQFNDVTVDGNLSVTGLFHFSETKESITFYNTSGNVDHNYQNNGTIFVNKTGGGDFTVNLTNVPTDGAGYTFTVVVNNGGGDGVPDTLNIDGQQQTIQWAGGSAPGMSGQLCVVSFGIIAYNVGTDGQFTVLGSGSNYG